MSRFAIRNPYFIVVVCLVIAVVGVTTLVRMPEDMFPAMNIPVVVVATFYSGMPPEQIETDITSRFERFFTLGVGIEHIESRSQIKSPTDVDHYGLRRLIDVYVQPLGEDVGRIASAIDALTARTKLYEGLTIQLRGLVQGMRQSFRSFFLGLMLSVVLLYLILVAQFQSFLDLLLILTAVAPGLTAALLILYPTQTSMNVMFLMGLMILIGMTVSDSILMVEFTRHLHETGLTLRRVVVTAARVRLRPVLMASLATIIGLLPMALKLGAGSESYAPLTRAVLGGMSVSLMMAVIMVPAAYYVAYRKDDERPAPEVIN